MWNWGFFIGALLMHWIRERTDWVLKFNRCKLGRVFPDDRYPGMWRSCRADGQLSDMANLTWAKAAVLAAAERDILPAKSPVKRAEINASHQANPPPSLWLKKTTENEKFAAMRCRENFFKDLVSSDGRSVSTLQHSIEISGAENITSAVEAAKRRYEQLRRVPIWSLCADGLELESEGKRTSYRPTRDEFALIPIPGRRNAVSDFAIES
jgi:hypothetical protein